MVNLINKVLFFAKILSLPVAFSFTLYILFMQIDYNNQSILTIFPLFLPFLSLLIIYVFGFMFNKNNDNLLNNLVSLLVFLAIIIVSFRTIFDHNIIHPVSTINFDFFERQEVRIKLLLYLVLISNLGLLYLEKKKNRKIHS